MCWLFWAILLIIYFFVVLIPKYFQIHGIATLFTCLFLFQKSLWHIFGRGVLGVEPQMFQWSRRGDFFFLFWNHDEFTFKHNTKQSMQFSASLLDMYKIGIPLRQLDISEEARWIFSINIPSFFLDKEWWRTIILLL